MNWWWTDDELMNWWSGLVWSAKTTTDCHWLIASTPLNTQTYIRGHTTTTTIYIPDSTNYKSTASGANNANMKPTKIEIQNTDCQLANMKPNSNASQPRQHNLLQCSIMQIHPSQYNRNFIRMQCNGAIAYMGNKLREVPLGDPPPLTIQQNSLVLDS